MMIVVGEMCYWFEYDYVVVNDDLECVYENVWVIFKVEWFKQFWLLKIGFFIQGMVNDLEYELVDNG